jgi:hypothetical protein
MGKFRILRVDDPDPSGLGKRNRLLYTIYGALPALFVLAVNLGTMHTKYHSIVFFLSIVILALISFYIIKKVRTDIKNLKSIGEIEITQSCLKKRIGDSMTEYNFQSVNKLTLTKHIPATRIKESKSGYFSFLLKIEMTDGSEESLVVSDRSTDYKQKLSVLETMKTLKKIVPFSVQINT